MDHLPDLLIKEREATVREHIAAEDAHDVERVLATFHTPHYFVHAFGAETPGGVAVHALLSSIFTAFPDMHSEVIHLHHAAEAVIVELRLRATHRAPWAGIAASNKSIDVRLCCIFRFDEDRLLSEAVYFDHGTVLAQISGQ